MVFITRGVDEAMLRDTLAMMTQSVKDYRLSGPKGAGAMPRSETSLLLPGDPGFDLAAQSL